MKKRLTWVLICVIALFLSLALTAAKEDTDIHTDSLSLLQYGDFPLAQSVETERAQFRLFRSDKDLVGASKALKEGLLSLSAEIDISAYRLTPNDLKTVLQDLINGAPELFHVQKSYTYRTYTSGLVAYMQPSYAFDASTYAVKKQEYETAIDSLLALHDPARTPEQTVLFYHDYLALHYSYDHLEPLNFDALSFLNEKTGVCQAYTLTMIALMDRLQIPCTYAQSLPMNHIWNVVWLDSAWYHVDVTWDDPTIALPGQVHHKLLLLSDGAMKEQNHYQWTTKESIVCSSTRFDGADWAEIQTPIVTLNHTWYGTRPLSGDIVEINTATGNASNVLLALSDAWKTPNGENYLQKFSALAVNDGILYYNTPSAICALDPITGITQTVLSPEGGQTLFGLIGKEGRLTYVSAVDYSTDPSAFTKTEIDFPSPPMPDSSLSVHLFDTNGHLASGDDPASVLSAMNDPQMDYLLVLSPREEGQSFAWNLLSLPQNVAKSLHIRPLSFDVPTQLIMGSDAHFSCDLTLQNLSLVSSSSASTLHIGEHRLTLMQNTSIGTEDAPVHLLGDATSSLSLQGESSPIAMHGRAFVGAVDLRGRCDLFGSVTTSLLRVLSASSIAFSSPEASLHTTDTVGANELTLIAQTPAPPSIAFDGIVDVLLNYLYPLSYEKQPLLTAPSLSFADLTFTAQSDGYKIDITPLFEKNEAGVFRRAHDSKAVIDRTTLVSYRTVLPSQTYTVPSHITEISTDAFLHCPTVKTLIIPSSVLSIGQNAFGFVASEGTAVPLPDFKVKAEEDSLAKQFCDDFDIPCQAFRLEENDTFVYRYYPREGIAELIEWKEEGSLLIIPDTLTVQDRTECQTTIGQDLTEGHARLTVYSSHESTSDRNPFAPVWNAKFTCYYQGQWHTLTMTIEDTLLRSLPLPSGTRISDYLMIPSTPSQALQFTGWDSNGDGIANALPEVLSEDLHLSAVLLPATSGLTVTWNDRFGQPFLVQQVDAGQTIQPPPPPSAAPSPSHTYHFLSWMGYTEGMTVSSESLSFTATYEARLRTYEYRFLNEDGALLHTASGVYGSPILLPAPPQKDADERYVYTFSHWQGYTKDMVLDKETEFTAVYHLIDRKPDHPSAVTSDFYSVKDGIVSGIDAGTTVSELLSRLNEAPHLRIEDANGNPLAQTDTVGTGMTAVLLGSDGETPLRSYTLSVKNDVSGDGNLSITDFLLLKAHLLQIDHLSEAEQISADISEDGAVSLTDFLKMKAILLGKDA